MQVARSHASLISTSAFLQTRESLLDKLENKYIKGSGSSLCGSTAGGPGGGHGSDTTIHLEQVTGLWYILCMGVGMAVILTLSNYLIRRNSKPLAPGEIEGVHQQDPTGSSGARSLQRPALNKYSSVIARFVGLGDESEPGSPRGALRGFVRMLSNSSSDPVEPLHEAPPNLQLDLSKVHRGGSGAAEPAVAPAKKHGDGAGKVISFYAEAGEAEGQGRAGSGVRAAAEMHSPAATARAVHPEVGTPRSPGEEGEEE